MSHSWKSYVTLILGILSSFLVRAQSTPARVMVQTAPMGISVTTEVVPLQDSLKMKPYLNVERSTETRPGARGIVVKEISIIKDALPLSEDDVPSAVKGTASVSSAKVSTTSVVLPPVDALPVDRSRVMVPKVAVRQVE